ncbi:phosphoglucosamine mutase [Methylomarinovum tepidoasis]|uniref:Phosphoglucosamine mutase n=1 Tax=Methylomarinovum tepidoasis TaxID=2840183 RepID=A0AAU9C1R4_9GAMM|nr:phosphoglucosamine mutase [Methylomarinovum sp. IN45]BCX89908.1 phosphoglucosamine mutase [Methylomarinovum sp. IN45]
MTRRYFGTDGIRGTVGEYPITPDFVLKLGWAAGQVFREEGACHVLVGKDTRISGYMFESALEAGLAAAGVDTHLLGPMPTPGIAYLTRTLRARTGIVISASHNPYPDNGIKFFSSAGTKLPDGVETAIEAMLDKPMTTVSSEGLGRAFRIGDAAGRYIEFCKSTVPARMDLSGLSIVVDCAHGATYHIAPHVFGEIGAKVHAIGVEPDGFNINEGCGSTHPETLQREVVARGADLGIAFDGDGDRVIMVDHTGEMVDGDELLYIIARSRQARGQLRGPVVGTQMSNLGLEHALAELGIDFRRAKVGDRYVMEMLTAADGILGGEGSGHIICLDRTTTGDGIVAALQVLAEMWDSGKSLRELRQGMDKYPQVLRNLRIQRKPADLEAIAPLREAKEGVERRLNGQGRVLLRPSGTEPVIRIMLEGRDASLIEQLAAELEETAARILNNLP